MNILGFRKNLVKDGRRRMVRDFRKRGLNPQDLKTIKSIQGWDFLLKVYTSKISPPRAEISLLVQPPQILIIQRKNPWNTRVVEKNINWGTACTENKIVVEFKMSKRLPPSMMWPRVCHEFMQPCIINKPTTKLQCWRWKVWSLTT